MDQEISRQLASIQNELGFLKSSLNPVFLFLQEIQDIKKKYHISQANSITSTSILLMDIKEEVLKDVTALQISTEEKLTEVRHEIKQSQDESTEIISKFRDELCGISLNSKDLFSSVNNIKNLTGENTMYIKEMRKEMDTKSSMNNIEEIRHIIKGLTPLNSYETLKSRVSECVSIYQYQDLYKKLEKFKLRVKNYVKTEDMDRKFRDFTMNLSKDFALSYVSNNLYESFQNRTEKMFHDTNEHILNLKDYINKLDNSNNDKIRLVKKAIESRPWKTEVNAIYNELNIRVLRDELEEFNKETNQSVRNFAREMMKFKNQVDKFEKVLERFDEILLDKAEKNDIKKLNTVVASLASLDALEGLKKTMNAFTRESEIKFQAQVDIVDRVKVNFDIIQEKFELLKKDNFDVTNLSASVVEFRQILERKAEKQDIYEIYDNMCKRIDFIEASEGLKILKKQVEQSTSLMFSLCRTLLKTGEPESQLKRQRYELLKNFHSLQNWIIRETSPGLNTINFTKNTDIFDNDDTGESRFPSRNSAHMRRRSAATAKDSKRLHVDFPKVS